MNPKNFRNQSLGFRGMLIVLFNEINAFKNNAGRLVYWTMQPILYFAFLVVGISATAGMVNYNGYHLPYSAYAVVGVISLIMTSQLSNALYRSTVDKQFGLMAIKFISGVKPLYYLAGMSTFPILGYIYQCFILYILVLFSGISEYVPFLLLAMVVGILMLLCWSSLGVICSSFFKNYQQRDIVTELIFSPLAFTAPSFYMDSYGPTYLKVLADINPMTYQLRALRTIAYGKFQWSAIAIAIIPTLVMVVLACWRLSKMRLTLQER